MDGIGGRCHQKGKPSITFEMSSCASSTTFVESVTSTSSLSSNSDKCYRFPSQLPPHLLFRITAYLDIVSKICLQSTNHYFRNTMHADRGDLNTCARYLLAHRSRQNGYLTTELRATRILCKESRNPDVDDRVQYLDEQRYEISKWIARALDKLPWIRRNTTLDFDKKHLHRINKQTRSKYWAHLMENLGIEPVSEGLLPYVLYANQKPTWLAFKVLRCTHCGKYIAERDTRLQGCVRCKCDFCFRAPENYFRRCGPGKWNERRPGQIFENRADGKTYAVEGSGKNRISVPVYNPFCLADRIHLLKRHTGDANEAGAGKRDGLAGELQLEVDDMDERFIRRYLLWCEVLDRPGQRCQVASI